MHHEICKTNSSYTVSINPIVKHCLLFPVHYVTLYHHPILLAFYWAVFFLHRFWLLAIWLAHETAIKLWRIHFENVTFLLEINFNARFRCIPEAENVQQSWKKSFKTKLSNYDFDGSFLLSRWCTHVLHTMNLKCEPCFFLCNSQKLQVKIVLPLLDSSNIRCNQRLECVSTTNLWIKMGYCHRVLQLNAWN